MGKWAARLAEKTAAPPLPGTDKTDKRVLSVLAVIPKGGAPEFEAIQTASARVRTCGECMHVLRRGTCGNPVAARLLTVQQGFGIVWPPEGHGATCAAFAGPQLQAQEGKT